MLIVLHSTPIYKPGRADKNCASAFGRQNQGWLLHSCAVSCITLQCLFLCQDPASECEIGILSVQFYGKYLYTEELLKYQTK